MKVGFLFLLLQCLIGDIYSQVIVNTITFPTKTVTSDVYTTDSVYNSSTPSVIDDEYITDCDTVNLYASVTTSLSSPTITDALNGPIFSLIPKTYELCVKEK